jgi:hypothetical protein
MTLRSLKTLEIFQIFIRKSLSVFTATVETFIVFIYNKGYIEQQSTID